VSRELLAVVERLHEEFEVAPPAAMLSDARGHYDREVGQLLAAKDKAVIPALLARAGDRREVVKAQPPHLPVEGGYGKAWGRVTVGDKARFALARLLGEALAAEAVAGGPAWWQANGAKLRWDARRGHFIK
jgi:hypothetical protein